MKSFDELLDNNREWAAQKLISDPEYFKRLSQEQKPNFLWIGCSDSLAGAAISGVAWLRLRSGKWLN